MNVKRKVLRQLAQNKSKELLNREESFLFESIRKLVTSSNVDIIYAPISGNIFIKNNSGNTEAYIERDNATIITVDKQLTVCLSRDFKEVLRSYIEKVQESKYQVNLKRFLSTHDRNN